MPDQFGMHKTIALARIATGFLFLLFGQYKVASPAFAHGGFQQYLQGYIQNDAVSFYRPILAHIVLPHAVLFGYVVGILELWIALSLISGLWVRATSIMGAFFMLNLTLATWWEPGHDAPLWRYFGAQLSTIPLLFLFMIFLASDAGTTWGLDSTLRKRL
jgi:uncharacterized membrane protein YphA (DoxX/SURF4 family)